MGSLTLVPFTLVIIFHKIFFFFFSFKGSLNSSATTSEFLFYLSPYLFFLSASCLQTSCHRRFRLPNFSCRILASVFEDCWIISSPFAFNTLTTVCRCPMPSWSSCEIPKRQNKNEAPCSFIWEKIKQCATTCSSIGRERNKKAPCESFSMKLTCPYPKDTRQKDTFYVSVKRHPLSSARFYICKACQLEDVIMSYKSISWKPSQEQIRFLVPTRIFHV